MKVSEPFQGPLVIKKDLFKNFFDVDGIFKSSHC